MSNNFRLISYNLIHSVLYKKAYPDLLLNDYFSKNKSLTSHEIKLITEIVYGVLRWKRKLEFIINLYLNYNINNKRIEILLLIGAYQILFLDSIPDYASISETVNIAKKKFSIKIKNLINAVLRQISRKKDSVIYPNDKNKLVEYYGVNYSYPDWLIEKWMESYGIELTEFICDKLNTKSEFTIRINTNRTDRGSFLDLIKLDYQVTNTDISQYGLNISNYNERLISKYYNNGLISIQGESSQLVSLILNPQPGEKVLDVCSAPGTKSNHIAELMNNYGKVISCDINNARLKLVNKDADRLGNNIIETVCVDARNLAINDDFKFDKILVDAPCSGFGTIKRNPDIKWSKNIGDIEDLANIQVDILNNVSSLLKPDGMLVYSVCTLMKEENEDVCEKFLTNNKNFALDSDCGILNKKINRLLDRNGYFSSLKYLDQMDGFFIAKFRKNKNE